MHVLLVVVDLVQERLLAAAWKRVVGGVGVVVVHCHLLLVNHLLRVEATTVVVDVHWLHHSWHQLRGREEYNNVSNHNTVMNNWTPITLHNDNSVQC